jgi:hypothetical protein
MFQKWLPQQGIFAIPLIREITLVLIIKLIVLFTIHHFYFSDPVSFNADHLFGEVSSSPSTNIKPIQDNN